MFTKIKNAVTSDRAKQAAKDLAVSLAIGVAVSVTTKLALRGIDYAANRIAEGKEAS